MNEESSITKLGLKTFAVSVGLHRGKLYDADGETSRRVLCFFICQRVPASDRVNVVGCLAALAGR